jgi:hypothetical protein
MLALFKKTWDKPVINMIKERTSSTDFSHNVIF